MSTLPIRVLQVPQISLRPAVMRVISVIATAIDVFAEAQEMARAAHKRYPFIEG
jgi:hypothetical protein